LLIWFSRHVDLYALLDQWADAGSNYEPRGVVDDSWYVDRYEIVLGAVGGGRMFDEAVRRLFRYDFYPQSFVRIAADFLRNDRPPQVGERVVQRVRVIPGVLDAVTMNIVSAVWEEPDRKGFTLVTSERQYETGEWTASILRRPGGEVALSVYVVSRPSRRLLFPARLFARGLQKHAHRLALTSFTRAVGKV
jgi:uncharacterized protein (UPF0548 family)